MARGKSSVTPCKPPNPPKTNPPSPVAPPSPATAAIMASQTEDPDPGLREQSNFTALMQAITTFQTTLTGKIKGVQLHISLMRRDMDVFCSWFTETERRVGEVEDTLQTYGVSLCTLQTEMKSLEACAEDAENRNRRNNLRIVGLPEGMEGKDTTTFTEHLLCTLLPDARFSDFFVVERARRMPTTAPPWTFILKLLNFRDRDVVLREARKIDMLPHEGSKFMIFPDYSIETQKQRRSFDQVKLALPHP